MAKVSHDKLIKLLKQYWGYDAYRTGQLEIITAILSGHDTMAVLPTGAGKSLCYQIPGLYNEGITLVISPLIALMKDQITGLKSRGIRAAGLFSGQSRREQDITLDNAIYGDQKFLFVSPERLKSHLFQQRLMKMNVSLLAIDEAHCISEWGHDFRPEYRKIAEIKEILPDVPFIAVTATATPKVVDDIEGNLGLRNTKKFIHSPIRANLSYNCFYTEAKKDYLYAFLAQAEESKIVYVNTRKQSKDLERHLLAKGLHCRAFHGGMERKEREACIASWDKNETRIIIATKAFGMGIDKSDVRLVLHYAPPQTVEAYIQEAGRAGRDGQRADSIVMYNKGDAAALKKTIEDTYPDIDYLKETYKNLSQDKKVATGVCQTEFYPFYLAEFATKFNANKFKTFNAVKLLHQFEVIYLSEAIRHPSRLRLKENRTKNLLANPELSPKMGEFIKQLLRNYEGLFLDYTIIDEKTIASKFDTSMSKTIAAIEWLHKRGVAEYQKSYNGHTVSFKEYRYPYQEIPIDKDKYTARKKSVLESIEALNDFISYEGCRQKYIARYFGFEEDDCQICDNCLPHYEKLNTRTLQRQIISLVEQAPLPIIKLYSNFAIGHKKTILDTLAHMEAEQIIAVRQGKITLNQN